MRETKRREALDEVHTTAEQADEWRRLRDAAIRAARKRGCTVPDIADAAGMSVNGVYRVLARDRHPSKGGKR